MCVCVIAPFRLRANKLIVNPQHDEGLQFGLGVLSNTNTDTCPVSVPAFAPHFPPPPPPCTMLITKATSYLSDFYVVLFVSPNLLSFLLLASRAD